MDDVASGGEAISLTKRGRPVAVLINCEEWDALRSMVRAEARDELARHLAQVRERVADADGDPAAVSDAIGAAQKIS